MKTDVLNTTVILYLDICVSEPLRSCIFIVLVFLYRYDVGAMLTSAASLLFYHKTNTPINQNIWKHLHFVKSSVS